MSVRPCVRASVRVSVHADISDMPGPNSFKVGTRIQTNAIHMHVNLFCDTIKFGRVREIFGFTLIEMHVSSTLAVSIELHVIAVCIESHVYALCMSIKRHQTWLNWILKVYTITSPYGLPFKCCYVLNTICLDTSSGSVQWFYSDSEPDCKIPSVSPWQLKLKYHVHSLVKCNFATLVIFILYKSELHGCQLPLIHKNFLFYTTRLDDAAMVCESKYKSDSIFDEAVIAQYRYAHIYNKLVISSQI